MSGGVMHCFTETWDVAKGALDLGFHISFSGIVTFKNAVELKDVARRVPLERMLIETDSPYLAPVPYRGKRNQPAYVRHVGEEIARLRGVAAAAIGASHVRQLLSTFRDRPMSMRKAFSCAPSVVAAVHRRVADMYEDFIIAVNNDRVAQVKELLAKGIDPNTVGPERRAGALLAARAGQHGHRRCAARREGQRRTREAGRRHARSWRPR